MLAFDAVLIFQALVGAFDNLWHHEWQARLPQRPGARRELRWHAIREALYGALFLALAWWTWQGLLALLIAAVLAVEIVITLADFLEEDSSRSLPPLERVLHTVLAISYGAFVALLAPVLIAWAQLPIGLGDAGRGLVSWLYTAFAAVVWAWALRNALAVRRLGREAAAETGEEPPPGLQGRGAILVTGGTGFVGRALVTRLRRDGRRVIVLARDVRQARTLFDRGVMVIGSLDEIAAEGRLDGIVHLAGARVLGLPWTRRRRLQLVASRTRITAGLLALIGRLDQRPAVLVAASAVGYYGLPGPEVVCTEDAPPMPGQFASDLCQAIESEARRAETLGLRVVRLRFGLILGRDDGAYPMQALAGRLGLGARLGHGRQPMPWIHLEDAIGLIAWSLAEAGAAGPVNAVAPERCDQHGFATALAAGFGRRVWLAMPAAPLRWLGGEMTTLLLDGQSVEPRRAQQLGYRFRFPTLADALVELRTGRLPAPSDDSRPEPASSDVGFDAANAEQPGPYRSRLRRASCAPADCARADRETG